MYQAESSADLLRKEYKLPDSRFRWTSVGRTVLLLGATSLFTDISAEMISATLPLYLLLTLRLSPFQVGIADGLTRARGAGPGAGGIVRTDGNDRKGGGRLRLSACAAGAAARRKQRRRFSRDPGRSGRQGHSHRPARCDDRRSGARSPGHGVRRTAPWIRPARCLVAAGVRGAPRWPERFDAIFVVSFVRAGRRRGHRPVRSNPAALR